MQSKITIFLQEASNSGTPDKEIKAKNQINRAYSNADKDKRTLNLMNNEESSITWNNNNVLDKQKSSEQDTLEMQKFKETKDKDLVPNKPKFDTMNVPTTQVGHHKEQNDNSVMNNSDIDFDK